jgi:hypothetical protein
MVALFPKIEFIPKHDYILALPALEIMLLGSLGVAVLQRHIWRQGVRDDQKEWTRALQRFRPCGHNPRSHEIARQRVWQDQYNPELENNREDFAEG